MPSITSGWNANTARMGPPRLQQGPITTALQLGPLASLVGFVEWAGIQCHLATRQHSAARQ